MKPVLKLLEAVRVKGLAHITGGGITGNVPRILPPNTIAAIQANSWSRPPVFKWLQQAGEVGEEEMWKVFNCGIGMVVIVAASDARRAANELRAYGETVYEIGTIEKSAGEPKVVIA